MNEGVFDIKTFVLNPTVNVANTPTRVRPVHFTMVVMQLLVSNVFNFIEWIASCNSSTEDVTPPGAM